MSFSQSKGPARVAVERGSFSHIGRVSGKLSRLFGGVSAVRATSRFLRRQLWVWPIVAAVILGIAGWMVDSSVQAALRDQRVQMLKTILEADVAALHAWTKDHTGNVDLVVTDERLLPMVQDLAKVAEGEKDATRLLVQSKSQEEIRKRLGDKLLREGYIGFFLVNPKGIVLAAEQDMPVGKQLADYRFELFKPVLLGKTAVSKPYRSQLLLADEKGNLQIGLPMMLVAAPIRDIDGKILAALGLRFRPESEFTRILQVARAGQTGETYALDSNGILLSRSRFEEDLKQCGLLVDQPDVQSILTVSLRDPGVNMIEGERPKLRRADQPFTKSATEAIEGRSGVDPDGYRDYRGVPRVGAWTWLPEQDFGVITEMDAAEAFRPVYILRRAFFGLMTLLFLSAIGIFVAMLYIARQQKALQMATLEAMQLGQYSLEEKLGAGGMGTVYRARHKMLRRPTAVKLLDVDKMSEAAIARFEREVQMTSSLTHPNTVAVFDYGRTSEGIFYYAMEYLDGMNLDDFIRKYGPVPAARAAHLMRQACGSLSEAHGIGLVHRDIKPANLYLTQRGGIRDFVKVLDFGLVKTVGAEQANITSANAMMGTPLYMAPESVNSPDAVDARSDVYSLGAVAYYLVTGQPVFNGVSVVEICMKHVSETPVPPSERSVGKLDAAFESLILRCLAKKPEDRPANAADLLRELDRWTSDQRWTADDAATWWRDATALNASSPLLRGSGDLTSPTPATAATIDSSH
ncbi:MAG: serine/threonine protein kinase [Gemmataceae bacterium]